MLSLARLYDVRSTDELLPASLSSAWSVCRVVILLAPEPPWCGALTFGWVLRTMLAGAVAMEDVPWFSAGGKWAGLYFPFRGEAKPGVLGDST